MTYLLHCDIEQHVPRPLYTEELSRNPDLVRFAETALLSTMHTQSRVRARPEVPSAARSTRSTASSTHHAHALRHTHTAPSPSSSSTTTAHAHSAQSHMHVSLAILPHGHPGIRRHIHGHRACHALLIARVRVHRHARVVYRHGPLRMRVVLRRIVLHPRSA